MLQVVQVAWVAQVMGLVGVGVVGSAVLGHSTGFVGPVLVDCFGPFLV